jgi:hypothetical protein
MISDTTIDAVKAATDLPALVQEYGLVLRRSGTSWITHCVFHEEKTASLRVHPLYFNCFGCGAKGDAFNFLMMRESITFGEALRILADRAGIDLHRGYQSPVQRAANTEDVACAAWWWKKRREWARAALDEVMLDTDLQPDDEWADCLGRMLRYIEGLKPAEKLQQFQFNVKGGERAEWRAAVAEEAAFGADWMALAQL